MHFILPTWEVQISSLFPNSLRKQYVQHIKHIGYQPYKVIITSEVEIRTFLSTVALCFNLAIHLRHQDENGTIVVQTTDPCSSRTELYLSARKSLNSKRIYEAWIDLEIAADITQNASVVHASMMVIQKLLTTLYYRLMIHKCTYVKNAQLYNNR